MAIAERRLDRLPGHDDEVDVAKTQSIANGRATGTGPCPSIVDSNLRSLERAEASSGTALPD